MKAKKRNGPRKEKKRKREDNGEDEDKTEEDDSEYSVRDGEKVFMETRPITCK